MSKLLSLGVAAALFAPLAHAQSDQIEVRAPVSGDLQSVCHVRTLRDRTFGGDGYSNGSAVLYRGRYLITAAHNVYSPWYNRLAALEVMCGAPDASITQPVRVHPARTRVASGYFWRRFDHDFAVIELPAALQVDAPFTLDGLDRGFSAVKLGGFPGSPDETDRMDGQHMFLGAGTMTSRGSLIDYDVATFEGNSGGPVWVTAQGGPALAGIHVSGGTGGTARAADTRFRREVDRMIGDLEATRSSGD